MSSRRTNTPFGDPPSHPDHSAPAGGIRGDYTGNTGDNNNFNSGNTNNNYYGDTHLSMEDRILRCLYTSGYESHRMRVRGPVEGTCAWVTEHPRYKEWLEKKTSGLLWLSADPGYGKSVIASFLVGHLGTHSNAAVCYFFFKDDSDEQRSATFALCAILHQLFVRRKPLCRYAEPAFRAKDSRFAEEVDTLWDILVKVVAAEGGCGEVICVVDALDECEQATQDRLMRLMAHLPQSQNSGIPLKLLVTSRPYHKIERGLGSYATMIRLKGEDEVKAITADVTRVIDKGIKELETYWERPGELGYLRDILESSADRTFIWVSLILEILKDCEDDSVEEFTNIASNAPSDLAELYTKILDKSTSPDKARRILNIVVAAARPLTLREMNVAFKISRDRKTIKDLQNVPPGFGRTVKNLCGHFVRIIDSKIYLVHQTAREFLLKGSSLGRGIWQYSLCPMNSNFTLADICISYLMLEEFEEDPLEIHAYSWGREGENLQKYVFFNYAARHWVDHFRDSGDRQMELFELTRRICEVGSKRWMAWFQVRWADNWGFGSCPEDFTHLMTATWLGQRAVVERLLEEGRDINARCKLFGTALNMAAVLSDRDMAGLLLQKNVKAWLGGKEYNILHVRGLIVSRTNHGSGTRRLLISGALSVVACK
ncbi:NACHT-ANK domain protein transcript variant 4 [Tuber magnatum]|uniref:NACHT-ANK domain protein transcript variant 4 n=1 Tax=Tuber magnatum TaxID=42249 RepID=A0A317SCY5_9PEZI|nr:NACHT-ANK domain protein transcript variant 4 [Tuber magnatum]